MSHNTIFNEPTAAISAIKSLMTAKAEAEAQIANCLKELASAKEMLDSVLTEQKTPTNKQYLKAAKTAWQASIEAYEASITAFRCDINSYNAEVDAILKRNPEARMDN